MVQGRKEQLSNTGGSPGQVLEVSGTSYDFASNAASLSEILSAGNTTDGYNISISDGDDIRAPDGYLDLNVLTTGANPGVIRLQEDGTTFLEFSSSSANITASSGNINLGFPGDTTAYVFSSTSLNASGNNIITTGSLSVGGSTVAGSGAIRLPNGSAGSIIARDNGNTTDITLLQLSTTDVLILGETGVNAFFNVDDVLLNNADNLRWANTRTPEIRQDAAPTGNGATFTVRAQNASEAAAGATQGGDLIIAAGDAIGAGAGDRTGGDVEIQPGIGTTSSGTLTPGVLRVTGGGSTIVLDELSDHSIAPVAGDGMIWVRNDAPNSLIFTNDAGTDFVIGGGTTDLFSSSFVDQTTTVDATPVNVGSGYTLAVDDDVVKITTHILAYDQTDGYGAGYELTGVFKRISGVVTQIGDTISRINQEDDITLDVDLTISGTAVLARVTGDAVNNVDWTVIGEVKRLLST